MFAAERVFDKETTGPLYDSRNNKWDKGHRAYNEAVGEALDDYLRKAGMPPDKMTADQAREFLGRIFESQDSRIRNYNMIIQMKSCSMIIQMREIMQRVYRRGGRE